MLYGLMDCNNFFVSCERVFRPDLETKPVVVLSNNDGCVVSRSNEAKAMNIPMGLPCYQLPEYDPLNTVTTFSSNYILYADLSHRVMSILADMVGDTLPYSIDECFFAIDMPHDKALNLAASIPQRVRQWTGIPVSVGIAPSKTLAKMACRFAKKHKAYHSFCAIDSEDKLHKAASLVKLEDVWGIGRRTIKTLNLAGFHTAADFCQMNEQQVRHLMGINGVRTWQELRGIDAIPTEHIHSKKSICTSRSFAQMLHNINDLQPLIANFASMCAAKLRAQDSVCNIISVFIASNPYRIDLPQYSNIRNITLPQASSSQIDIVSAALQGLKSIYQPNYAYKRAGVILNGISPASAIQLSLFCQNQQPLNQKKDTLSSIVDHINKTHGSNTIHLASQLPRQKTTTNNNPFLYNLRQEHLSPRYTTNINDIIKLH